MGDPTYPMLPSGWIVLHKNKHSSLDEVRSGVCNTKHGGVRKLLHVMVSILYVRYAVHYILILYQGGRVRVKSFGRLCLVS